MRNFVRRSAEFAVVTGSLVGVGSCVADIATCPGEVEQPARGGDVSAPVLVCDENPEGDDFLNNPGTTEQKVMFGGLVVALTGGGVLFVESRQQVRRR